MGKLMGAKIGSLHTLDDLGLYLLVGSPLISGAEPDKSLCKCRAAIFCSTSPGLWTAKYTTFSVPSA